MTRHADRFFWSASQWSRACELAENGKSIEEISIELKVTPQQTINKFTNESYAARYDGPIPPWTPGGEPAIRAKVPQWKQRRENSHAEAVEDRDRRADLRAQQDLTAAFFGDPPSGYSALDRRRASA